jgi:hypothetical protein
MSGSSTGKSIHEPPAKGGSDDDDGNPDGDDASTCPHQLQGGIAVSNRERA